MVFRSKEKNHQLINGKRILEPIEPSDDRFHGAIKHVGAEWWYFDAIFTNDYSIHLGLRTYSKKKRGMISPQLEIYKDGQFLVEETTRFLFKDVDISKTLPIVKHNDKVLMAINNDLYEHDKKWQYHINLFLKKYGFDLTFDGTTPGWKFETDRESWTVSLPKSKVKGTLMIDGEEIPVEGMGYHDHNWNYNMVTVMNYGQGWYWGKIASKHFNIVWAKIVKSNKYEIIAVINKDGGNYYNIDPKNIDLTIDANMKVGRFKTPSHFHLKISEIIEGIPINVDVDMHAHGIHYNSIIVAPYFRYHVKSTGTIAIGSEKETVNDLQIMEYLRFS
jgi:hypothetical protein